jgi:hypothetical protein
MHRDGIDVDNVQPEDILCDFCVAPAWSAGKPCIEGHQGSLICGDCLTAAYKTLVLAREAPDPGKCCLCLEERDEPAWRGSRQEGVACRRCIKQAAGAMHKSKDWDWVKPLDS